MERLVLGLDRPVPRTSIFRGDPAGESAAELPTPPADDGSAGLHREADLRREEITFECVVG